MLFHATGVGATFTATTFDKGVMVNPAGLVIATVTFPPLPTVIFEIANVRVNPVPDSAPFVAPVTVILLAANVVGSTSKVRVSTVVVTLLFVPLAVRSLHATGVGATLTATVLDEGEIVNPAGLVMATVTFAPLATVIFEIVNVRELPVPVSATFVAPVTVMLSKCSVVGSALKVRVSSVVVTLLLVPLAVMLLHETAAGALYTATTIDEGVMVNPVGLAMATVTFSPLATVIFEIVSVRVEPDADNVPFVAPVTVMLSIFSVVGSAEKVRVS